MRLNPPTLHFSHSPCSPSISCSNLSEPNRVLLDAYARRHEAQKIYLRQAAAQRWIEWRGSVLQGQQSSSSHRRQLKACDERLRLVRAEDLGLFLTP